MVTRRLLVTLFKYSIPGLLAAGPLASDAPASPLTVKKTKANAERFILDGAYQKLGYQAACYRVSPALSVSGVLSRNRFTEGGRGVPARVRESRSFKASSQGLKKRCRKSAKQPESHTQYQHSLANPIVRTWADNMRYYGKLHCMRLLSGSLQGESALSEIYYDAQFVFHQIAEYTGDSSWLACAAAAGKVYRDLDVLPMQGYLPGYWNFTHGLTLGWLRSGEKASKAAALLLARNAAYARDATPREDGLDALESREVAYAIHAYLNEEAITGAPRPRLERLADQALGHLAQWFTTRSAPVKSFMVGLTSHALISYHERTRDPRVVPALSLALRELWNLNWDAPTSSFHYQSVGEGEEGRTPAPDLNLLIAPAYAWLYHRTGDTTAGVRADLAFEGGVSRAYLRNGKQFNQNYRWSFDYVKWRYKPPHS